MSCNGYFLISVIYYIFYNHTTAAANEVSISKLIVSSYIIIFHGLYDELAQNLSLLLMKFEYLITYKVQILRLHSTLPLSIIREINSHTEISPISNKYAF